MKRALLVLGCALLAASCAEQPKHPQKVDDQIVAEMNKALERRAPAQPEAVSQALLPPLRAEMPRAPAPVESRFDLVVNNAPAEQVFMSIVSGTRYSMLISPSVTGAISVNLKDVTVPEAMDSIREVYGYEYRIDGTRIYVMPSGLQTRLFQVNYLIGARQGRSDMRVSTGAGTGALGAGNAQQSQSQTAVTPQPNQQQVTPATPTTPGSLAITAPSINPGGPGALSGLTTDATRMSTVQLTDFWAELAASLRVMIGNGEGRSVVVSPQSGVVVVRAMPQELRGIEEFLKAMQLSVERQVMLEAKIIDVTLSDAYQAGVNWAAFPTSGIAGGFTRSDANTALGTGAASLFGQNFVGNPSLRGIGAAGAGLASASGPGGVIGLALQTRNFAALLEFLQSQGTVQVLSSPRVATLNNQKAVLKVGLDELFVTNLTPSTTSITNLNTGNSSSFFSVTPTLGSIFSGISLDITPQIDESGNVTLHVHPLFSRVTTKTLSLNLGSGPQPVDTPVINISESDTIVRTTDGNIIALGGLMRVDVSDANGGVPGLADAPGIGAAFRNTDRSRVKRELVILIKPTIIQSDRDQEKELQEVRDRMSGYGAGPGPEGK